MCGFHENASKAKPTILAFPQRLIMFPDSPRVVVMCNMNMRAIYQWANYQANQILPHRPKTINSKASSLIYVPHSVMDANYDSVHRLTVYDYYSIG